MDRLPSLDCTVLGADDASELAESPEVPDVGESDNWLPLDGSSPLEAALPEACDGELTSGSDPADVALLAPGDDCADSLSVLVELTTDACDTSEGALGEVSELPDSNSLLWPLMESSELVGDALLLAGLPLLTPLGNPDDLPLAPDEKTSELNSLDGGMELSTDDAVELGSDGCGDVALESLSELDPIVLADDWVLKDDGWLPPLDV